MNRKRKRRRRGKARSARPVQQRSTNGQPAAPGPAPQGINLMLDGLSAPETWPPVSLCMIVKDEEENLAACVESVGDLAAEIIIVDTGSSDRTVEIARSLGARVKHFRWVDDFAAARNESIKDAGGDWIFWMDADDRLSPRDLVRVKQALVSGRADVYLCRVVSHRAGPGGPRTAANHARLFPNRRGLQFEGVLHETMEFSALRQGLKLAQTNIEIAHTGYEVDADAFKDKARRNLEIVAKTLAKDPHNLYWRFHQATSLSILERYEEAAEIYETVIARPPENLNRDFYLYQAHISLLDAYLKLDRRGEARQALDRALAAFPRRRHLAVAAGMFYLMLGEPEEAIASLKYAQTLSPDADGMGHAWQPGQLESVLGRAYMQMGQLAEAMTYLAQALLIDPDHIAAQERLSQIAQTLELSPLETVRQHGLRLLRQKNFERAGEAFALLLQMSPADAGAYKSLAVALHGLGQEEDALLAWQTARRLKSPLQG